MTNKLVKPASKSTAITVAPLSRDQLAVFNEMPKALQSKAKAAIDYVRGLMHKSIFDTHAFGQIISEISGDEPKYGSRAVEQLAHVLDMTANVLWVYRKFATVYSLDRVKQLVVKADKTGYPISVTHFQLLAAIDGPHAAKIRKECENLVIEKHYTTRDLQDHLQIGGKKSKHKGPTPKPPKSPIAGIGQISAIATDMEKRIPIWDEHVFHFYETAGADQLSNDHLDELRNGMANTQRARDMLEELINSDFSKAIIRVERIMSGQPDVKQKLLPAPKASPKPTATPTKRRSLRANSTLPEEKPDKPVVKKKKQLVKR
jgi:hypothetical protein